MITISYYRKSHRVDVNGHANSANKGHDLVCCAVSVLTYTLASFVSNMSFSDQLKARVIKLIDGDARISCKVDSNHDDAVTLVFDSLCAGYELLRENYPDFIKYELLPY